MKIKNPISKIFSTFGLLWILLTPRRRRQLLIQQLVSLASSGAEVSNLVSLLFLLNVISEPTAGLQKVSVYLPFIKGMEPSVVIVLLGGVFVFIAVLSAALRVAVILGQLKLAALISTDLSSLVFQNVLYRPYTWHLEQNSSYILGLIFQDVETCSAFINSLLGLSSNILIVLSLGISLITISPVIMLCLGMMMILAYWFIYQKTRATLYLNGLERTRYFQRSTQSAQEGIGGIRDIIIDSTQPIFSRIFNDDYYLFRINTFLIGFKAQYPRYIIESLSMISIISISLFLYFQGDGIQSQLPILGSIALGTYRILQPLQTCFSSIAGIKSSQASINKILPFTTQISDRGTRAVSLLPLIPDKSIRLTNVFFRYSSDQAWILQDLNLTIPQGSRVAFVGTTGSGKSTTIDLILGLLKPTQGKIFIGDQDLADESILQAWQSQLAHVPQFIYLRDASFAENIAFGVSPDFIDQDRVRWAAAQAQIADLIETQPRGYEQLIGERGVKLSGGQRQRLGIARALYKKASVLIFDEATSALDNETEAQVIAAISETTRDLTLIMIAHRLSTVQNCDIIFLLRKGKLVAHGSYDQLLQISPDFARLAQAEDKTGQNAP